MATQARIEVNSVPGSNDALPINTLVQLSNADLGGETTYLWSILDQPPGLADSLSSTSIENPTFTPKKEGSYLLQLIVNFGLPDEQRDRVVCAVRQLKTLERIPAAGETTEVDLSDGWANAMNALLRRIDGLLSDPGIIVGANNSGGSLARGDVVRTTGGVVIKSGLPGQETVPGFDKAPASSLGNVDELLCVVEGAVSGGATVLAGALMVTRYIGRIANLAVGVGAVGDPLYVSDTATISVTQGTIRRQCGSVMAIVGGNRDVWFDGVGGADITPIGLKYMLYGPPGASMLNTHRIDGNNATPGATGGVPYTFRSGDDTTVGLAARRNSGTQTANIFQVQDHLGAALAAFLNTGDLDMLSKKIQKMVFQAQDAVTVPLFSRRYNAGAAIDLFQVQDETATALVAFKSTGDLDMLGKKIQKALFQAQDAVTVPLIAKKFNAGAVVDLFQIQDETGAVQASFGWGGWLNMNNRSINNVSDPAAAQDAATRNFVEKELAGYTAKNVIINSAFDFSQRYGSTSMLGALGRQYCLDRWVAWQSVAVAFSVAQLYVAAQSPDPYSAQLTHTAGQAAGSLYFAQEIDRGLARWLAGQPAYISFWARRGAGAAVTLQAAFRSETNLETDAAFPNYPVGDQLDALGSFALTTSWTKYTLAVPALRSGVVGATLQFIWTAPNVGVANEWAEIRQVMVNPGTYVQPWERCGRTLAYELLMCSRYYEKSYVLGTVPGTNTPAGQWSSNVPTTNIAVGGTIWMGLSPRFRVRKRALPTIATWTAGGVASNWTIGGVNLVVVPSNISETGFELTNGSGGIFNPGAPYSVVGHWTATAEI